MDYFAGDVPSKSAKTLIALTVEVQSQTLTWIGKDWVIVRTDSQVAQNS